MKNKSILITIMILVETSSLMPITSLAGNLDKHSPGKKEQNLIPQSIHSNNIPFTQNKGQIIDTDKNLRPDVLYKGDGMMSEVYLRKTGLSYVFNNLGEVMHIVEEQLEEMEGTGIINPTNKLSKKEELLEKQFLKQHRVDMDFIGAYGNIQTINDAASASGTLSPSTSLRPYGVEVSVKEEGEAEGTLNYYYPHCQQGASGVKQFSRITYKNIYNNIDVRFYSSASLTTVASVNGSQSGLKYDIIVNPHTDPNQIKLCWTGAEKIYINNNGNLVIKTSINEFYESIPKVYQVIDGKIVDIKARYVLNGITVSFALETLPDGRQAWNPEYPLIIDPATWATYYGGNGEDYGTSVAVDPNGNPVFTGWTRSLNFPVNPGAHQVVLKTGGFVRDSYVVKFNSNGVRLFGTYFGGNDNDVSSGIAADLNGDTYITGATSSLDFPIKTWFTVSYSQAYGGGSIYGGTLYPSGDAYIAKFSTAGLLIWSTYYGGSGDDRGIDIITDAANNIIVSGTTPSTNFPTKNPYQAARKGTSDAFVLKFNNKGVRQWATYYGGSAYEEGGGLSFDASNNIFFSGMTASTDFPLVQPGGAFVQGLSVFSDLFVAKLSPATGFPVWSTCYGGPDSDAFWGSFIKVDKLGNAIVGFETNSLSGISTPGAYQTVEGGGFDIAILKFNNSGVRQWCTYLGGTNGQGEIISGIDTDDNNNIYIIGEFEDSDNGNYPISACAIQPTFGGSEDQLIAKYDPSGKQRCITFRGGTGHEDTDYIMPMMGGQTAIYGNSIYITGSNETGGYPVTPGAFQTVNKGTYDAIMDKLCINICETKVLGLNFTASAASVCVNKPITLTPSVNNTCDTSGYTFQWTFTGGTPAVSSEVKPIVTYSTPGTYPVKVVLTTACKKDSLTKTSFITVTPPCGITVVATGAVICPGSCAAVSSNGNNGTAPYSYNWSTGATTQNISSCPIVNTTYTVTVTDAVGSTSTASTSVIISSVVTLTTSADNETCNGTNKGTATATAGGGITPYFYLWNNGQTTAIASGLTTGNYTVTVTDSRGCTNTQSIAVPAPTPVTITLTISPRNVCTGTSNGSISVVPVGGTTPYAYLWSNGNTGPLITQLPTGTYTVTVTDGNGCTETTTAAITTFPALALTTSSIPNKCTSGSIGSAKVYASGAPGPYGYMWNIGNNTRDSINGLSAGTYSVTVIDGNGCSATSNVAVAQAPSQSSKFAISPDKTVCLGSTVTFTNTSGVTNSNWQLTNYTITPTFATTGSGNVFSYTFNTPPGTGTFTIVQTNVLNGCLSSTSDTVVVINCPPGAPGIATLGGGCFPSGNCTKSLLATAAGGTAPYTYKWSTGATTNKIFPCATANTTYIVTVTDATGVTNTTTTSIIIGPSAAFTKSQNGTVCMGTTVNFSGISSAGATYSWNIGAPANVSGTTLNFSYNFLTAGNYPVTHTAGNGTCTDNVKDTIKVINCSGPTVSATGSSICPGSCANVTANGLGGNTPYAYTWSTGATTQTISACPVVNTTYTVTIRDAAGITATSTAVVTINTAFTATTIATDITCSGNSNGSTAAAGGSGSPPYIYNWSNGQNTQTSTGLSAGNYTVTITDSKGCTAISTATIISPPALTGQFSKGTASCAGCGCKEWVLVNATGGTSPYTYSWPDGYVNRYKNKLCPGSHTINIKDKNGCNVNISLSTP